MIVPRPYQLDCLSATRDAFASHTSALDVLATGLGKTVIAATLMANWPSRCLMIAHRDELIRQAAGKIEAVSGERPSVEMASEYADEDSMRPARAVVSSVQTLCRPGRQKRFDPKRFGLLVIDEAHHATAASYLSVIDHFRQNPKLKILGITATPKRADQAALGQVFDTVAFDYGIEPAIEDGWLVPIRQQAVKVEGLDFSRCRSIAGDLCEADLESILRQEEILHRTAAPTIEIAGDLPALVFCVTVAHARAMAEILSRYKPQSARALDGSSPKDERAAVVNDFRQGRVQFLCNCGLFLEGFDAPSTALIVMARPTKSMALYTQCLGRGTRPLPGVVDGIETAIWRRQAIARSAKPNMTVLDFVGNSGRHKIITSTDLLGGKYGEPVRTYARQTAQEEGRPMLVDEQLQRAADELALLQEAKERARRAAVKARAQYMTQDVSPFGHDRTPGTSQPAYQGEMITPKQAWFLILNCGYTRAQAETLTKQQASRIIAKAKGN